MPIKIGRAAIGEYIKTGKNTERQVLDYLPAGTLRGTKDDWSWYFDRPSKTPSYVVDMPDTYKRFSPTQYIKGARAKAKESA